MREQERKKVGWRGGVAGVGYLFLSLSLLVNLSPPPPLLLTISPLRGVAGVGYLFLSLSSTYPLLPPSIHLSISPLRGGGGGSGCGLLVFISLSRLQPIPSSPPSLLLSISPLYILTLSQVNRNRPTPLWAPPLPPPLKLSSPLLSLSPLLTLSHVSSDRPTPLWASFLSIGTETSVSRFSNCARSSSSVPNWLPSFPLST